MYRRRPIFRKFNVNGQTTRFLTASRSHLFVHLGNRYQRLAHRPHEAVVQHASLDLRHNGRRADATTKITMSGTSWHREHAWRINAAWPGVSRKAEPILVGFLRVTNVPAGKYRQSRPDATLVRDVNQAASFTMVNVDPLNATNGAAF